MTLASPFLSCPGLFPHSGFRCCCCADGIPRWFRGHQSRRWTPYFSSSADSALWISRIGRTDRTWYTNIDAAVDMSVNTRIKEPKRGQRGKTTDCRAQNSPCWARCMTAFLYWVNVFKWIRLEIERCPALAVRSRSVERVKVEKAEGKYNLYANRCYMSTLCRIIMFWASKA